MNYADLTLFIRAAATANLSAAGRELGLSPASASARIAALERELGVRLLHRTTRRVSLTDEGAVFLHHAEQIVTDIDIAKAAVGSGVMIPSGRLRVAASASFGRQHVAPKLADFLACYPKLQIDLRLTDNVINMVDEAIDVALRIGRLPDSTLVARKLASNKRLLCAAPDYLKKRGTPRVPADLAEHNCLILRDQNQWVFRCQSETVTVKVSGNLRADNGESLRDAAAAGLGIAIQSSWNAHNLLHDGSLVPILTDYTVGEPSNIWAVYPSARFLAPKVRAFIDFFAEQLGSEPYWE